MIIYVQLTVPHSDVTAIIMQLNKNVSYLNALIVFVLFSFPGDHYAPSLCLRSYLRGAWVA